MSVPSSGSIGLVGCAVTDDDEDDMVVYSFDVFDLGVGFILEKVVLFGLKLRNGELGLVVNWVLEYVVVI